MAHARRQFFELADIAANTRRDKNAAVISPIALEAVKRIDALFDIERGINGQSAEERLRMRKEQSAPPLTALEAWLREQPARLSNSSAVAKPIDYMLRRWDRFARFIDDGRICLTNNAEGASSPAETLRAQIAADLFRVERERAKTQLATARRDLAILMGDASPRFGVAVGRLADIGQPPPFKAVIQAIEANPQLMRWTAITAQRNAELIIACLKAVPDVGLSAGWRHFQATNDNAVRLGVSVPLPVFDRNTGNIIAAQESLAKTDADLAINKLVLLSIAGRAYDTLTRALAELKLLRSSLIPNARSASETLLSAYSQGRFTLLELLDVRGSLLQALLREQEALQNFHIAVATIEGLVGNPFSLTRESSR